LSESHEGKYTAKGEEPKSGQEQRGKGKGEEQRAKGVKERGQAAELQVFQVELHPSKEKLNLTHLQ
jgi:hypothetical protein